MTEMEVEVDDDDDKGDDIDILCSTRFSFSFPFLNFILISITILTALSKLVLLVSSTTYPSQSVKFFKIGIGEGGNLN